MANPTTTPPTVPEWDSAANPNLQFYAPLTESSGAPRDLVSGKVAMPFFGFGGTASGPWPTCPGDTISGVTFNTYRLKYQDRGLRWFKAGWPNGTTFGTARTFAAVVRIRPLVATNAYPMGTMRIQILSNGNDANGIGIGVEITANGVISLGCVGNNGRFYSLNRALVADRWYAIAVTFTSGTGRILNIYDYTAQAADSQASSTDGTSVSIASTNYDVVVGNAYSDDGGLFEIANALLAAETWDSGSNTRFADWYADPWLWARREYTSPGGTLTAGDAISPYATSSGAMLSCSRPTLGTNGTAGTAYTQQWYYSDSTADFTPPSTGTILTGATTRHHLDTTLPDETTRFYRCLQSDGANTALTSVFAARKPRGQLRLGMIGDSRLSPSSVNIAVSAAARCNEWDLAISNRGLGGSYVLASNTQATLSWYPGVFSLKAATATGGTYTLTWRGQTTSAIAYNASAATIQSALEALSTVGAGNVSVAGSSLTSTYAMGIQFTGAALPSPVGSTALTVDTASFTGTSLQAYSLYGSMVAQFQADGVTAISYSGGTNDTGSRSYAQALADHTVFRDDLVACGFTLYLHGVCWRNDPATVSNSIRVVEYQNLGAALANGSTVFEAGHILYDRSIGDQGASLVDGLHENTTAGYYGVGFAHWHSLLRLIDPTYWGSSSGTPPRWVPRRRR